jgi:amidase
MPPLSRRDFLYLGATVTAATVLPRSTPLAATPVDLDEITIAQLQSAMQGGTATARSIAELYLGRIEALDRNGPRLHAIIELNPDALATADALDVERKANGPRGPLHGIPVLLKDNIDTADRMRTSAGSLALAESRAQEDAPLVHRLRAAGVVILGKTNLSEWANFRSTHSTSGWSGRGGLTRNPYVLDRNPCGSSSGSAVATSANLAVVAIGTETDGSILSPASACGVVGIKPTVGLVSGVGIIPIAHSQDTAGPLARTVTDAALLLGVLAGRDYGAALDSGGLKGARVGVARNYFGFNEAVDRALEDALRALREAGAELKDPANIATARQLGDPELEVLLYEFKADLNTYLGRLGPDLPARSLAALIDFNERHREQEMPYFGQDIFEKAEAKGPLTERSYQRARATARRLARSRGIDATLHAHKLDAIIAPTIGPACVTDLINGDHWTGESTSPAAVAGYPSITVPAAFVHELPVGLSFIGAAGSEATLIRLAYAFEQATKVRRKPAFTPTAALRLSRV